MTRKQQKRRMEIIRALSDMSRNWGLYTAADWLPLERELEGLR